MTELLVSGLICTRNRPEDVGRAVRSVLASEGVDLDLIVIDQSDGPETAQLLEKLTDGTRLRYVRSRTRGLGAALDEGLRMARSPYVIHTDDDCVVPTDWVSGMAAILDNHPDVGLVFCNVTAASHDQDARYIPAYEQRETRILRSPLATCRGRGIGAGMGFRRDAVLAIGGVDGMMGAGSRFPSGEDMDVQLRMLLKGWHVMHTAEWAVVHHGFRIFAEGRDHTRRDWLGIGACLGKLLRAGHPVALVLAVYELAINAVKPALMDIMNLRRPRGMQRFVSFFHGFAQGLAAPADSATIRFIGDW